MICYFDASAYGPSNTRRMSTFSFIPTHLGLCKMTPEGHYARLIRDIHREKLRHVIVGGEGGMVVVFYVSDLDVGEGRGFSMHPMAFLAREEDGRFIAGEVWIMEFGKLSKAVWARHQHGWWFDSAFLNYVNAKASVHHNLTESAYYTTLPREVLPKK